MEQWLNSQQAIDYWSCRKVRYKFCELVFNYFALDEVCLIVYWWLNFAF